MKNFGNEEAMATADMVVTPADMEFLEYLTTKGVMLFVSDPTYTDSVIQITLDELPTFLSYPVAFYAMRHGAYEGYIN
jgi:hypothetical protein